MFMDLPRENFRPLDASGILSWVHSGDLHLTVWCDQAGRLDLPVRSAIDTENTIGAYPSKGLSGTHLGPNGNGHGWGSS